MKKVIYLILVLGFCSSLYAQQNVCIGAQTSLSANGSYRTGWKLLNGQTLETLNDVSGTLFVGGGAIPWDVKRVANNNVQVRINNTNMTRFFKVEWATYNRFNAYIGGGEFFLTVPETIPDPFILPAAPGNPLTAQCGINISVTNPQAGATYNWSNGQTGNTVEYTSFTPAARCTATCAVTPAISNEGVPPSPPFSDPVIGLPSDITVCEGEFFSLSASAVTGCLGISWSWSTDGLSSFFNNSGSSPGGSTAFYSFNLAGTYSITASGTSALPPFAAATPATTTVTVLSGGGFCSFLTSGGGNTESAALKTRNTSKGSAMLYPNPVSDILRLDQLQDYNNLRVVDQYGKVLNTQVIGDGETQKSLNVAQFANGLYLIQFTNKTGEVMTKKFQVMH